MTIVAYDIPTPTASEAHSRQTTALSGVDYIIKFDWSSRIGAWTFDLLLADGTPLLQGAVLVPGWDVMRTLATLGRPPGILAVVTTDGEPPTLDGLESAQLIYLDKV